MLTKADEGEGGVQEPMILADVICEQPHIGSCKTGFYPLMEVSQFNL